jgi:hypothetical protein
MNKNHILERNFPKIIIYEQNGDRKQDTVHNITSLNIFKLPKWIINMTAHQLLIVII